MIRCAGGLQDVKPNSAVTELFWQTHLQNPKRYRKDLRALAKLAELLEEEKAKERRMFERRKRERDNMQRKSQERKRGESDSKITFYSLTGTRNNHDSFCSRGWWLEAKEKDLECHRIVQEGCTRTYLAATQVQSCQQQRQWPWVPPVEHQITEGEHEHELAPEWSHASQWPRWSQCSSPQPPQFTTQWHCESRAQTDPERGQRRRPWR